MNPISGVLKRVETGDDLETCVGKRKLLELANVDFCIGAARTRNLHKPRRGVNTADFSSSVLSDAESQARSTPDVEQFSARCDFSCVERGRINGSERLLEKFSPRPCPGAPELPLYFGVAHGKFSQLL